MRTRGTILWILAFLVMAGAGYYQRRTGPTHPMRGRLAVGSGEAVRYSLVRSGTTGEDAIVELPRAVAVRGATLHYRRLGAGEEFRAVPFAAEGEKLVAALPTQPPAGKLEYFVTLVGPDRRLPADEGEHVVIRFKGAVPAFALIPHIAIMFLSMMIGVRAAFAALVEPARVRRLAVVTLAGLGLGGLVLGPIVQKYAFGAYWTGWPLGEDLTDTKTLFMWGAWLLACLFLGRRCEVTWPRRAAVLLATLVMLAVYLVPHSLRGSTLDYRQLERGVPAEEAIQSG